MTRCPPDVLCCRPPPCIVLVMLDHYVQRLVAVLRDQVKVVQRNDTGWCEMSQPKIKNKMSK